MNRPIFYLKTIQPNNLSQVRRVQEIASGFGGPSEKNVSPH